MPNVLETSNPLTHELQDSVNWNKVFGVIDSLYNDTGFTSNADNFARATMVEKALDKFSNLKRVDQDGYDFTLGDLRVELKMGKNLFYKGKQRSSNSTKKFKMKNFQGDKKTVEDYKEQKTFDYLLVIDITVKRVVVINDKKARTLYEEGGDGVMISLNEGDYYECNLPFINVTLPPTNLSVLYNKADENYLDF